MEVAAAAVGWNLDTTVCVYSASFSSSILWFKVKSSCSDFHYYLLSCLSMPTEVLHFGPLHKAFKSLALSKCYCICRIVK